MAPAVQERHSHAKSVQDSEHKKAKRGRYADERSFMNSITTFYDRRSLGPWMIICILVLVYVLSPHLPSGIREYLSGILR